MMFVIDNLTVSIDTISILKHLSLKIEPGQVHALMGPNGSGKSTLAHTIVGNPSIELNEGSLLLHGEDISQFSPHERAKRGIFLSFQQPPPIPGLSVITLLREMCTALGKERVDTALFEKEVKDYCALLHVDDSFLTRSCNDGFSGGEKKRFELLQMLLAKPQLLILDEIDSGLDIDALKLAAQVIKDMRDDISQMSVLIITHYQRILDYITADRVHLLVDGTIMHSGDASLVHQLEQKGYHGYFKSN